MAKARTDKENKLNTKSEHKLPQIETWEYVYPKKLLVL